MTFLLAAALTIGAAAVPLSVKAVPAAVMDAAAATLSVTGYGEISRPPDLATVSIAIITGDDNSARSLSENNRRFAALTAKLDALNVAAADVQSASLDSYFNPRPATAPEPNGRYGYIVTRSVQIKVRELRATGNVVDAAAAAGATQISGISYGFRDRPAIERAALAAAVNDAYAQAQTIVGAAHLRIVRVLHIGNDNAAPIRLPVEAPMMARAAAAPVATTIEPTDQAVSRSIAVTYIVR